MDVFKFVQTFTNPSPEVHHSLDMVQFNIRYGNYDATLAELEKLSNDAALTEAQKRSIGEFAQQVKQKQASNPAAPAPAQ